MALILVDLDGTVVNLTRKWFRVLREEFGDLHLNPDALSPVWDVDRISRGGAAVYDILLRPGFFRDLEPYPHAVETLWELHAAGHDIVIVTDAGPHNYADKLDWVKEHLPFVPVRNFVATGRKELLAGNVILDDSPHVLEACVRAGRLTLAMDRPYNAHVRGCLRAAEWPDVMEIIMGLFGGERHLYAYPLDDSSGSV